MGQVQVRTGFVSVVVETVGFFVEQLQKDGHIDAHGKMCIKNATPPQLKDSKMVEQEPLAIEPAQEEDEKNEDTQIMNFI